MRCATVSFHRIRRLLLQPRTRNQPQRQSRRPLPGWAQNRDVERGDAGPSLTAHLRPRSRNPGLHLAQRAGKVSS
jgi:hypothetical protein